MRNALERSSSEQHKIHNLWSCQKMCDVIHYLLDNIFIRFCLKMYRQLVSIGYRSYMVIIVFSFFMTAPLEMVALITSRIY